MKSFALLALLTVTACDLDFTGARAGDEYLQDLLQANRVASVHCPALAVAVGTTMKCEGRNAAGTTIGLEGATLLIWSVSSTAVLGVDAGGLVTARAAGQSQLMARGPQDSFAAVDVVVAPTGGS